jgi:hypothetical protein
LSLITCNNLWKNPTALFGRTALPAALQSKIRLACLGIQLVERVLSNLAS